MAGVPMDQREGWIWFDGELKPWKDAKIHVLTHGLHYASCVFEGERAYGGEIFKSREHTERLIQSGKTLDFTIPYSVDEIEAAKRLVLEKNGLVDAYVRPVAWRGSEELIGPGAQQHGASGDRSLGVAELFLGRGEAQGHPARMEQVEAPEPGDDPVHGQGRRPLHDLHAVARTRRWPMAIADALMLDYRGYVAEATGANVFFIKGDEIHTPDARLLPQRPHPADGDRARQGATASR